MNLPSPAPQQPDAPKEQGIDDLISMIVGAATMYEAHHKHEDGKYLAKYIEQLKALIEADRNKATLEARIDELNRSLREYERTDFETGGSDLHQHYLRNRLNKLESRLAQLNREGGRE